MKNIQKIYRLGQPLASLIISIVGVLALASCPMDTQVPITPDPTPTPTPDAPMLVAPTNIPSLMQGIAIDTIRITNSGGAITNCTASGLPQDLSADVATCAISGTPSEVGTFNVNLTATGEGGSSDTLNLSLTVTPVRMGSSGNDTLTGTDADETFNGGAGDDTIDGAGGTDTSLYPEAGTYTLSGDSTNGYTVMSEALGTDSLRNIEVITLSSGDDTVLGTVTAVMVLGGAGRDTIVLSNQNDSTHTVGTGFANYLNFEVIDGGSTTGDTLNLGNGEQSYTVGSDYSAGTPALSYTGFESIDGGAGADTLVLTEANDDTTATNPVTFPAGYSAFEILSGGEGSDNLTLPNGGFTVNENNYIGYEVIIGGDGDDSITTGAGDQIITGGAGADSIDGGAGNDTLRISETSTDTITLGGDSTTGYTVNINNSTDTIQNVEAILFSSTDSKTVSGEITGIPVDLGVPAASATHQIALGTGDNTFTVGMSYSNYSNFNRVDGGAGADTLNLTSTDDSFTANASSSEGTHGVHNSINYDSFATVNAGDGTDTLIFDSEETQTITAANTSHTVDGVTYNGFNIIDAGGGSDSIFYGDGDDTHVINGPRYRNFEFFTGGAGTDTLVLPDGDAVASGTTVFGFEIINGGAGNDTITNIATAVTVNGGTGNDTITLTGRFAKTITGGAGDDTITVSNGTNNSLSGNAGNDTFVVPDRGGASDSAVIINDFSRDSGNTDVIRFFGVGSTITISDLNFVRSESGDLLIQREVSGSTERIVSVQGIFNAGGALVTYSYTSDAQLTTDIQSATIASGFFEFQ